MGDLCGPLVKRRTAVANDQKFATEGNCRAALRRSAARAPGALRRRRIPCEQGKDQGISRFRPQSRKKDEEFKRVTQKFPARRNREFFYVQQGISRELNPPSRELSESPTAWAPTPSLGGSNVSDNSCRKRQRRRWAAESRYVRHAISIKFMDGKRLAPRRFPATIISQGFQETHRSRDVRPT